MIVRIFYSVRFAVAHTIFLLYTLKDIWNPHIVDGGEYILQKTIGIDLGGTNMSVGIVDENMEIIGREALSPTMPTWILVWQVGSIIYGKML